MSDSVHLLARLDRIEERLDEIAACQLKTSVTLAEAKGGWRMLMLIAGAAGTAGAAVTKVLSYLSTIGVTR